MTTTRRPHGLIYGLLAVSLAINLVGVGYFAATGFKETKSRPPKTVERTIDFVAARYPDAVGEAVRKRLEARRDLLQGALAEMKDARRAARKTMGEEPLDRNRVEAAFANSREKVAKFQSLIHGAIVEALPDLPEPARASIDKNESE